MSCEVINVSNKYLLTLNYLCYYLHCMIWLIGHDEHSVLGLHAPVSIWSPEILTSKIMFIIRDKHILTCTCALNIYLSTGQLYTGEHLMKHDMKHHRVVCMCMSILSHNKLIT